MKLKLGLGEGWINWSLPRFAGKSKAGDKRKTKPLGYLTEDLDLAKKGEKRQIPLKPL